MLCRTVGLLGVAILLALPGQSRAQGVMPGGWDPQFGFQVVAGPGAVAYGASGGFGFGPGAFNGGGFGFGTPGFNGNGFGFGAQTLPFVPMQVMPGGLGTDNRAYMMPNNQSMNALNPLAHSIRHATRTRRGR